MDVIIRADASKLNGGGHVARCLNLAKELEANGAQVQWACSAETLEMRPDLCRYNPIIVADVDSNDAKDIWGDEEQIRQAQYLADIAKYVDILIVDQYFLSKAFEDEARSFATKIAVIDEKLNRPHSADMIFDFLPHTTQDWSDLGLIDPQKTQVNSGPDFMMLSPMFAALAKQRLKALDTNIGATDKAVKNVVITSGAFDGVNIIGRVLGAIERDGTTKRDIKIDVPILSKAPHIKELRKRVSSMKSKGYDITLHEDCTEVPALISKADIHVGSAATSTYEAGAAGGVAGMYYDCGHMQKEVGMLSQRTGGSYYMGHHEGFAAGVFNARLKTLLNNSALRNHRRRRSAEFCRGRGLAKTAMTIMG